MKFRRGLAVVAASLACMGGGLALLGDGTRALVWLAAGTVVAVIATVVSPWLFAALALAIVGSVVHAWVRARRTNAPLRLFTTWPLALLMANFGVGLVLANYVVTLVAVRSSTMLPALDETDRVVVDELSRAWRPIERGDVIAFRFPCKNLSEPDIRRVVAVAGDTVELRCGLLYINGSAVPTTPIAGECSYAWGTGSYRYTHPCTRRRELLDGRAYDVLDAPDRPGEFPGAIVPTCRTAYDHDVGFADGKIVDTAAEATPCGLHRHYIVPPGEVFVMGDQRELADDSRRWGALPTQMIVGRVIAHVP